MTGGSQVTGRWQSDEIQVNLKIFKNHDTSKDSTLDYDRNKPNKSKLALYKLLLNCNSCLRLRCISNKSKRFNYKDWCGIHGYAHIEAFQGRADLGYR